MSKRNKKLKAVPVVANEKVAAPTHQLDFVEIEKIETLVYSGRGEEAIAALFEGLQRLRIGGLFVGHSFHDAAQKILATRVCAVMVALLANPKFMLSEEGHARFAIEHPIIECLFWLSGFRSPDFMLGLLSENPSELDANKLRYDSAQAIAKATLFFTLNSQVDMKYEIMFAKAARTLVSLWAGMLSHVAVCTKRAHQHREELYLLSPLFRNLSGISPISLGVLSDSYMYCSYRTNAERHKPKADLTALFNRQLIEQIGRLVPSDDEIATRRRDALAARATRKPVCIVGIEWFGSFHAMHRCYANLVAQLRSRFHLIAATRAGELDATARAYFDDVIEFPRTNVVFEELFTQINAAKPDLIYWPSLGMNLHWTMMATVRLAPIQLFTLGHPATTMSPAVDYAIVDDKAVGDPALLSERVVYTPPMTMFHFKKRADTYLPAKTMRLPVGPIKVAITAMALKINYPFLEALAQIRDKAKRQIEFHFFPNTMGLTHIYMMEQIQRVLPGAHVRPRVGYERYLEWMEVCDLHLSTFPFGGTNSVIDSLLIGTPIVTRFGPEPMERFEGLVFEHVGLSEAVAHSTEEYIDIAVALIDDNAKREALAAKFRSVDWDKVFFNERTDNTADAFGKAVWHIFENHEQIVASGAREIPWKDYTE